MIGTVITRSITYPINDSGMAKASVGLTDDPHFVFRASESFAEFDFLVADFGVVAFDAFGIISGCVVVAFHADAVEKDGEFFFLFDEGDFGIADFFLAVGGDFKAFLPIADYRFASVIVRIVVGASLDLPSGFFIVLLRLVVEGDERRAPASVHPLLIRIFDEEIEAGGADGFFLKKPVFLGFDAGFSAGESGFKFERDFGSFVD